MEAREIPVQAGVVQDRPVQQEVDLLGTVAPDAEPAGRGERRTYNVGRDHDQPTALRLGDVAHRHHPVASDVVDAGATT